MGSPSSGRGIGSSRSAVLAPAAAARLPDPRRQHRGCRRLDRALAADLLLIGIGIGIVSTISVAANISYANMLFMGIVLTLAVAVPYLIERFGYRRRSIRFPMKTGKRWSTLRAFLLAACRASRLGDSAELLHRLRCLPALAGHPSPDELARLFVGVNAVGIWDELFFICVVFTLLRTALSALAGQYAAGDDLRVLPLGARLPGLGPAAHHPVRAAAGLDLRPGQVPHLCRVRAPAVRPVRLPDSRARP